MAGWENFEEECTTYLQNAYGAYAKFRRMGGSDSTIPDILVSCPSGDFYIEVKEASAQCGQFVLLPNIETRSFDYSTANKTALNHYSEQIIQHMNADFDAFRNAGTAGKDIVMNNDQDIFANWIIGTYIDKGARFVITENHTLFPIERFKEYFDIYAKYRIKRSGSGNVGKSRIPVVKNYLYSSDFIIKDIIEDSDKLFVVTPEHYHDRRFVLGDNEYMLSSRDNVYEVRKLSNTYNANVIFSIRLRGGAKGLSSQDFIAYLQ